MSTLSPARASALALAAAGRVAAHDHHEGFTSYLDTSPVTGGWIDSRSTIESLVDLGLASPGLAVDVDRPGDWFEVVVTDAGREALERVAAEGRSARSLNASRREALRHVANGRVRVVTMARRRLGFYDRSGPFSSTPFSWLLSRGLVTVHEDALLERHLELTEVGRSVLTEVDPHTTKPPAPVAETPSHDLGART